MGQIGTKAGHIHVHLAKLQFFHTLGNHPGIVGQQIRGQAIGSVIGPCNDLIQGLECKMV